ncbi:MAG: hypothetical protein C4K58_03815 [Flavobacteriaceae bacterium]|nr:MAG: hypothetical protein C4K58_03815 [Flavobacteriaceae bacterium]
MKKNVLLGLFIALGTLVNAQEISLKQELIDYGTIANGANGKRVFEIKNTGKKPLIITNVEASCGCTTPEVPKKPILPGKTGTLTVSYDTQRTGPFLKSITVYSNAIKEPRKVLKIKGIVKPAEETGENPYVEKIK